VSTVTDAELWRRTRSGDADAFASLFDRYAHGVYRYCFRRTANWAFAEDITSIVFLESWRRRREVALDEGKVLPWLLGVATNVIRNQRRSLRRYESALSRLPPHQPEPDFADELSTRLADEDRMRKLLDRLDDLTEAETEAFALCAWEGFSSTEAGEVLGVPARTIRTRLRRARAKLRDLALDGDSERNLCKTGGTVLP
jgi:RNA polymerase sigma factor (sigma-70 family)